LFGKHDASQAHGGQRHTHIVDRKSDRTAADRLVVQLFTNPVKSVGSTRQRRTRLDICDGKMMSLAPSEKDVGDFLNSGSGRVESPCRIKRRRAFVCRMASSTSPEPGQYSVLAPASFGVEGVQRGQLIVGVQAKTPRARMSACGRPVLWRSTAILSSFAPRSAPF